MSTNRLPIPVELQRFRHVDGEALRSADFRDALANDAQLRWWHNRAKHDSYGVARGLAASIEYDDAGVPWLKIEAGVAYDCFGREVFVREPRTVPLPELDTPGDVAWLLLHAPEPARRRTGNGAEGIRVSWSVGPTVDQRAGVPIARARRATDVGWTVEPVRFGARAAARARIGRGRTIAGATDWRSWTSPDREMLLGVETLVDTSPAGFKQTPCYFAHFAGASVQLLIPILHLTDDAPSQFRARVFLGLLPRSNGISTSRLIRVFRRDVALCWLGVEPTCRPDLEGTSP